MSAFIVKNSTINRIVNFCFWESDGILKYNIQKELTSIGINLWSFYNNKKTDRALKNFGLELLRLNAMGVYSRYGESEKSRIKEAVKKYKYEETPLSERSIYQVLKSIHCFLYQCSEGNIPNNELYRCMEKIQRFIESHIINGLAEYESAEWG